MTEIRDIANLVVPAYEDIIFSRASSRRGNRKLDHSRDSTLYGVYITSNPSWHTVSFFVIIFWQNSKVRSLGKIDE